MNSFGNDRFDPFLNGDATRLYLAPVTGERQRLAVAVRDSVAADFGTPTEIDVDPQPDRDDSDPAVSIDERILVFSSRRTGGGAGGSNLWYATRADARSAFGPPSVIPGVNSEMDDGDPMLSADGCELLFASTRREGGATYRLYSVSIAP